MNAGRFRVIGRLNHVMLDIWKWASWGQIQKFRPLARRMGALLVQFRPELPLRYRESPTGDEFRADDGWYTDEEWDVDDDKRAGGHPVGERCTRFFVS